MMANILYFFITWRCHGTSGMLRDVIPARLDYNWLGVKIMRLGEIMEDRKLRALSPPQSDKGAK